MEDKYVYRIGGSYGESYSTNYGQVILLFGCFVFLLLSIVLTVIDLANIWFLGFWVFFSALLIFIFSKLYDIEYDANWFYLKRLFYKTQKISVDDFLEIKKVPMLVASVYVVFKDKKVLSTGKYVFNPFNLFMTNKEYNQMCTAEVKNNIKKAKNKLVILLLFLPFFCFGQINEQFSDGDFTENPRWEGMIENFIVNADLQLQSNAPSASQSFLFTPSQAINNAVWETWVRITYPTSANNYASIYIISDRADISDGFNGYYVQIGGQLDEISLFLQQGARRTKIIDGIDRRVDMNPVEVNIKVTRDEDGNFELYSRLASEAAYFLEGTTRNTAVAQSQYFGVLFSNTNTTGRNYFFDDIFVTGERAIDLEPPVWNSVVIEEPNKLLLDFSKPVDIDNADFWVDNGIGFPYSVRTLAGRTSVELEFSTYFERGITYTLEINGLTDLSGNTLIENRKAFGLPERIEYGDLLFNEIMFENPENSVEYIELINASDKILDISGFVLATRRTDGSLTSGVRISENTLILPNNFIAFCSDAQLVRAHHNAPPEANIVTSSSWTTLNNQSATLVLTDETQEFIFDELTYHTRWHHPLVRNAKGVALERISPFLPTQNPDSWHSASSETNFGTPGYRNSQFRETHSPAPGNKFVWLEPEAFSPDGDGFNDICFIHYRTDEAGYAANVAILNASGVKVRRLASNELLAAEGFFMWDGTTDRGQNANVGIYILLFEKFHVESGKRKQVKMPLVVSAR